MFLAEDCSHCNTMLKPILPELISNLLPYGIIIDVIETADILGEFGPWDIRRKLMKDLAYKVCGTPYIVIEYEDSKGEVKRRAILGTMANKEDYRAMILWEIILAILERYIPNPDARLGIAQRIWSRYFSDVERPDGTELYDVLSDVSKILGKEGFRSSFLSF